MQIWTPIQQPRDGGEFPVHINTAGKRPFAIIGLSGDSLTALTMESPGDCDRLINAAMLAKSLLLGETSEPVTDPDEASWPPGKTFGELTPAQRDAAAKKAVAQVQDELTRAAPHIEKILNEADGDAGTDAS